MESGKLDREMDYMRGFFKGWVGRYGAEGPLGALAAWLGADALELHGFETTLAAHGVNARAEWFVKQRCDLILAYFTARLHGLDVGVPEAGSDASDVCSDTIVDRGVQSARASTLSRFDEASAVAISLARRLLHIDGQDLVRYRPREIADLLAPEVAEDAADTPTNFYAESHLADIQAALDLGYDWCLRLARPALRKALDKARERIERERHCPPEIASIIAEHSDLGTLALLAEKQRHSLGELY